MYSFIFFYNKRAFTIYILDMLGANVKSDYNILCSNKENISVERNKH